MSMSASLHGVPAATGVRVHDHAHFAVANFDGAAGNYVTVFPARTSRRSAERDLAELARLGDNLARKARRAAHDRRTRLRTEGVERALAAAS